LLNYARSAYREFHVFSALFTICYPAACPFSALFKICYPAACPCAYDQCKVEGLETPKIRPIIPPRRNAKITRHGNVNGPRLPHDEAIRKIRRKGRKSWKD
jgi:hypothetical protein